MNQVMVRDNSARQRVTRFISIIIFLVTLIIFFFPLSERHYSPNAEDYEVSGWQMLMGYKMSKYVKDADGAYVLDDNGNKVIELVKKDNLSNEMIEKTDLFRADDRLLFYLALPIVALFIFLVNREVTSRQYFLIGSGYLLFGIITRLPITIEFNTPVGQSLFWVYMATTAYCYIMSFYEHVNNCKFFGLPIFQLKKAEE